MSNNINFIEALKLNGALISINTTGNFEKTIIIPPSSETNLTSSMVFLKLIRNNEF